MPCWITVVHHKCPREKEVAVLRDISVSNRNAYAVVDMYQGRPFGNLTGLTQGEALELADELCDIPGQGGDSSWLAVMSRLRAARHLTRWPSIQLLLNLPTYELPARWEGSAAAYASHFFAIGSWNWLATLAHYRSTQLRRAA